MFKSNGSFISLDDFFIISNEYSLRWKSEVEERIHGLDALYEPWTLGHWEFTKDVNNDNKLNYAPYTVIEIMRQAATSYITAQFNASILLSSVAVEKIVHFLMDLNELHEEICMTSKQVSRHPLNEVQTGEGKKYFGFWKNRFGEFIDKGNGTWSFYEIESLGPSIDAVGKIGYDIKPIDQRVDGSHRLFVSRRDALIHGNFESLALVEQIEDIRKGTYKDQGELMKKIGDLFVTHKTQAFEEYKAASEFIIGVFKKFDMDYTHKS